MKFYPLRFRRYGSGFDRMSILRTSKFSVNIHRLPGPDPDWLLPHDHGCDFFSLILRGGYTENVYRDPFKSLKWPDERSFGRWSWHILRRYEAHRLVECDPGTLTLFITWNHQGRRPMVFSPLGHLSYKDYYGKGLHLEHSTS